MRDLIITRARAFLPCYVAAKKAKKAKRAKKAKKAKKSARAGNQNPVKNYVFESCPRGKII